MEYELLEENKDSRRLPDRLGDSEGLLMSGKIHGEHPRCPDGFEFPIETNSFGDSIASDDVFDASLRGHQLRKMDPAFLCLTDDQKASSALCSDLYEEVVCQINSIASVRKMTILFHQVLEEDSDAHDYSSVCSVGIPNRSGNHLFD